MIWTTGSIFCLILIIGNISAARHKPKIVGGDRADLKHYPFIVSLRYNGRHVCGGSIISDRHILTAAHCTFIPFEDFKKEDLRIHSGTSRLDAEGDVHEVLSIRRHPKYNFFNIMNGFAYDICVMTLKEPIIFNEYQQKMNLSSHDVQYYKTGYVLGWGNTSGKTLIYLPSTNLKKLRVTLLPGNTCKLLVNINVGENHVCAFGSDDTAICRGDSGGPIVSEGEIVGVASRMGGTHCASGAPDIYTNVFACKDFIESVMNDVQV